jgi:hypothetical protein
VAKLCFQLKTNTICYSGTVANSMPMFSERTTGNFGRWRKNSAAYTNKFTDADIIIFYKGTKVSAVNLYIEPFFSEKNLFMPVGNTFGRNGH